MKLLFFTSVIYWRGKGELIEPPNLPNTTFPECEKAIAASFPHGRNWDCVKLCDMGYRNGYDPEDFPPFLAMDCMLAHYVNTFDRVQPDNECFSNWIFGYAELNHMGSYNGKVFEVPTPAMCQTACQEDKICAAWTWVSEARGTNYGYCLLKSQEQLNNAMYQSTEFPTDINPEWCSVGMDFICSAGHYNCVPCIDEKFRCVWRSDQHLSGWKGCEPIDTCEWVDSQEIPGGPGVGSKSSTSTHNIWTEVDTTTDSAMHITESTTANEYQTIPEYTTVPAIESTTANEYQTIPEYTTVPATEYQTMPEYTTVPATESTTSDSVKTESTKTDSTSASVKTESTKTDTTYTERATMSNGLEYTTWSDQSGSTHGDVSTRNFITTAGPVPSSSSTDSGTKFTTEEGEDHPQDSGFSGLMIGVAAGGAAIILTGVIVGTSFLRSPIPSTLEVGFEEVAAQEQSA